MFTDNIFNAMSYVRTIEKERKIEKRLVRTYWAKLRFEIDNIML